MASSTSASGRYKNFHDRLILNYLFTKLAGGAYRILSLRDNHRNPNILTQLTGGAKRPLSSRAKAQISYVHVVGKLRSEVPADVSSSSPDSPVPHSDNSFQTVPRVFDRIEDVRRQIQYKKAGKGLKKCTTSVDDRRIKILCSRDKRISWTPIRSDLSDADVSVNSKRTRSRLVDSCKSADGIDRLHNIDGTLNVIKFIDTILEPKTLPSNRNLFTNNASFIFQQDSASCHTVKRQYDFARFHPNLEGENPGGGQGLPTSLPLPPTCDKSVRNLSTNILRRLWGLVEPRGVPTNLTRELAARRLFRVPPCRKDTIHLQTAMSSPGLEPRSYGTAVSVANHYTGWATFKIMRSVVISPRVASK
ncbi:transposable element Tcb1 transposase [Trichonephila clavipes]|uniref:Transposable element Tcb1 transposase n=1 Tax=Trichonephila clavipes TaxID=2585209 RepID=A0A8X6VSI2_TRICX|nr:transposable element Tcb1 transposase [Trichonephila clavipes]